MISVNAKSGQVSTRNAGAKASPIDAPPTRPSRPGSTHHQGRGSSPLSAAVKGLSTCSNLRIFYSTQHVVDEASRVKPLAMCLMLSFIGRIAIRNLSNRFIDRNSNRPHLRPAARPPTCPHSNGARRRTYKVFPQSGRQKWPPECCQHHEPGAARG